MLKRKDIEHYFTTYPDTLLVKKKDFDKDLCLQPSDSCKHLILDKGKQLLHTGDRYWECKLTSSRGQNQGLCAVDW